MENINKSIIYGNIHQNKYGKFLPICSPINDRSNCYPIQTMSPPSQITFMKVAILRNTIESPTLTGWRKFPLSSSLKRNMLICNITKITTAMRPQKAPVKSCCICWKSLVNFSLISDVKNVFIACLIQQFNPLLPFETTNYRAIV